MPADIFLIRHGQSEFNAALDAALGAVGNGMPPENREERGPMWEVFERLRYDETLRDARLSAKGHEQVAARAAEATDLQVDLVLVSPLTRALQTAVGLFGLKQTMEVSPLHAERVFSVCDQGRSPNELAIEFPTLRFGHLDERWWHHDPAVDGLSIESDERLHARVERFRLALAAREEQRIAVVGHGLFFEMVFGRHLENCEIVRYSV